MSSVFLLIPLALATLAVAAWAFVWAVRNQQFDDLDSPGSRILFDDEEMHASSPRLQRPRATPARATSATTHEDKRR